VSTVKVSELPVLASADAADEFVVVDDSAGVTKKITFDSLATDVRTESEALTATTVSASGLVTAAGITFGSDTLDDYEEGTWVPSFNGTSTDAIGVYVKVGNVVHWWLHVVESVSSGTDTATWTLPFTAAQSGGGVNGARGIGTTSFQEFSNRQLGVLAEGLPDNKFELRDGSTPLNLNDANDLRFFASGSFTTA